jgi:hypothetical protein
MAHPWPSTLCQGPNNSDCARQPATELRRFRTSPSGQVRRLTDVQSWSAGPLPADAMVQGRELAVCAKNGRDQVQRRSPPIRGCVSRRTAPSNNVAKASSGYALNSLATSISQARRFRNARPRGLQRRSFNTEHTDEQCQTRLKSSSFRCSGPSLSSCCFG